MKKVIEQDNQRNNQFPREFGPLTQRRSKAKSNFVADDQKLQM
jgi:hypothetical protein